MRNLTKIDLAKFKVGSRFIVVGSCNPSIYQRGLYVIAHSDSNIHYAVRAGGTIISRLSKAPEIGEINQLGVVVAKTPFFAYHIDTLVLDESNIEHIQITAEDIKLGEIGKINPEGYLVIHDDIDESPTNKKRFLAFKGFVKSENGEDIKIGQTVHHDHEPHFVLHNNNGLFIGRVSFNR